MKKFILKYQISHANKKRKCKYTFIEHGSISIFPSVVVSNLLVILIFFYFSSCTTCIFLKITGLLSFSVSVELPSQQLHLDISPA